MRKKTENKGIIEKYLKFLNVLKNELTNNSIKDPYIFMTTHRVSTHWVSFLKKNNVIVGNKYDFYKWNDKIPVSIKLIELFRKHVSHKNMQYQKTSKNKLMQPEIQFDMKSIQMPPQLKPKTKTRTRKVKVQQPVNKPTQQNEYGLIRKFLKWIY